jgi:carboxypeptidase Q
MRHRTSVAAALLAACLGCAPGAAQESAAAPAASATPAPEVAPGAGGPTAALLRERGLADELAWDLVASLTTEVGARFAGSDGDRRGVEWAVANLRQLGFENVRAEPVTVPRWVRGEAGGDILAPFPQPLHLVALGGSIGTAEEGVTAEVVAFETVAELEAAPAELVRGKIVYLGKRMAPNRGGSEYRATVPNRGRGASAAAAKGGVGLLIRSVGTGTHRFPHTGSLRYADDVPRIPAAALAVPDADLLEAQLAHDVPVRVRFRLTARALPDAESANVIAEVRGNGRPEEIVLLSCHLDSWDLGTGALDDAAGCGIVIAAARLIAELPQRPARTLRLVLYANEEFGLSGARAYAAAHVEEAPRHVLAMEADLGAGRVWGYAAHVTPGAEPLVRSIFADLAPLGVEWVPEPAHGGADLGPLDAYRVPMMDLRHDATRYFDFHHTADDTLDKVDREELRQCVAAYAVVAWRVAADSRPLGPAPERAAG